MAKRPDLVTRWNEVAQRLLVGRTIVKAEYLSAELTQELFDWGQRTLALTLDDGTLLVPQADDEGNAPGVLTRTVGRGGTEPDVDRFPICP